jgi:hypothetical protein
VTDAPDNDPFIHDLEEHPVLCNAEAVDEFSVSQPESFDFPPKT